MSTSSKREARLNVRLPNELKAVIEEAAAALGQTVSDYAVSTLVRNSRTVLQQSSVTMLSDRDRDRFIAALDDVETKPNGALVSAAKRYKRRMK